MAIQSASAKLYVGVRVWAVDKNISAALTSSFTLGNRNRPASSGDTVFANVLPFKLRRAVADLVVVPSISLVDSRLKTSGGGNNVITLGSPRVINNTNNWKVNASVVCKFPTYFRIDVEKLQLPEGTTCTVEFEEGWIKDGEYLESTRAVSPAVKNFFTFRTPWYGLSFISSQFTQSVLYRNFRPFSSFLTSAFTPVVSVKVTRAGTDDMQSAFTVNCIAGEIVRPINRMDLIAIFGPMGPGATPYLEGNGYPQGTGLSFWPQGFPGILRIRQDSAAINNASTASLSAEVYNLPFIVPQVDLTDSFTMVAQLDAFKGVGTPHLQSESTLIANARVDYNSIIPTMQTEATVLCRPVQDAEANIVAQSSLTCNAVSTEAVILKIVVPSGTTHARTFGFMFAGNVFVNIDWGDGQIDYNVSTAGTKLKTYATAGTYFVSIDRIDPSGFGVPLEEWRILEGGARILNGVSGVINPAGMVRECLSFGKLNTINLNNTFFGCTNLTKVPSFLPPTVQTLNFTFDSCTSLNDSNISLWNISNVNSLYGTFDTCQTFNRPLNGWNVSNVTNMQQTFANCVVFNQDITGWNTSNVTNMAVMFNNCQAFNQNIGSWNVSKVTEFSSMFLNALAFNGNIENWTINTTAERVNMYQMFYAAITFNRPIGSWNTSKVIPIPGASSVSGMTNMFGYASSFNQNLSTWCVTSITSEPSGFDTNTPAWVKTGRQPIWGTCP